MSIILPILAEFHKQEFDIVEISYSLCFLGGSIATLFQFVNSKWKFFCENETFFGVVL